MDPDLREVETQKVPHMVVDNLQRFRGRLAKSVKLRRHLREGIILENKLIVEIVDVVFDRLRLVFVHEIAAVFVTHIVAQLSQGFAVLDFLDIDETHKRLSIRQRRAIARNRVVEIEQILHDFIRQRTPFGGAVERWNRRNLKDFRQRGVQVLAGVQCGDLG